jgi:hypothetical protein
MCPDKKQRSTSARDETDGAGKTGPVRLQEYRVGRATAPMTKLLQVDLTPQVSLKRPGRPEKLTPRRRTARQILWLRTLPLGRKSGAGADVRRRVGPHIPNYNQKHRWKQPSPGQMRRSSTVLPLQRAKKLPAGAAANVGRPKRIVGKLRTPIRKHRLLKLRPARIRRYPDL